MNASALPFWRRTVTRRLVCIGLAMLPALVVQTWRLDPDLPLRLLVLCAFAAPIALLLHQCTYRWSQPHPRPVRGDAASAARTAQVPTAGMTVLDILVQAALLAALWPATVAVWPAVVALVLAWIVQRLLGGWAVNPFSPVLLALAVAVLLARVLMGVDFTPPLVSLIDATWTTLAWLAMGLVLIALRLWPARAPVAFLVPVALILARGGIASTAFVVAAIVAGFVLADTRQLPATASGQSIVGALAGLGTAALWFAGAPAVTVAFPLLTVYALAPWIQQHTLPRQTTGAPPA